MEPDLDSNSGFTPYHLALCASTSPTIKQNIDKVNFIVLWEGVHEVTLQSVGVSSVKRRDTLESDWPWEIHLISPNFSFLSVKWTQVL